VLITGVQVFSTTKIKEREVLGEKITEWVKEHPEAKIIRTSVVQSSAVKSGALTPTSDAFTAHICL